MDAASPHHVHDLPVIEPRYQLHSIRLWNDSLSHGRRQGFQRVEQDDGGGVCGNGEGSALAERLGYSPSLAIARAVDSLERRSGEPSQCSIWDQTTPEPSSASP
jgi:hypothetical protein